MREAVAFLLLVCACGAAARHSETRRPEAAFRGVASEPESTASRPASRFDDLVARAAAVAPGMHEVLRIEGASERFLVAHAERRDMCVRAAFEASTPIIAALVDTAGNVLAATDAPARQGVLGGPGPVCVRRGETVSAAVEPAGTLVRWVAWATGN